MELSPSVAIDDRKCEKRPVLTQEFYLDETRRD